MKPCLIIAAALFVPLTAHAQAAKSCEELKSEIAKKMDANGVKTYSLEIVAKETDANGRVVVGTCDGGKKKILYARTTAASATETSAAKTKQ